MPSVLMTQSDHPTISVILPFYNAIEWLRVSVESILAQSFRDFELLAIDDKSTDGSPEMLRKYFSRDPRLRIITNPEKGFLNALNHGISLARGRYIARMDADDIAWPARLQKQFDYMEAHPECVVLGSRAICIDAQGRKLFPTVVSSGHDQIVDELLYNKPGKICHPASLMRTDTVRAVSGYQQEYHFEDVDLFLRMAEFGKLANLDEPLLSYRLLASSISRTRDTAKIQKIYQAVAERAALRLGLPEPDAQATTLLGTPESKHSLHCNWSAQARKAGYRLAALKHAWIAFRLEPFNGRTVWTILQASFGAEVADRLSLIKGRMRRKNGR